ncbi:basic leucine zipper transcriptional factor ATF-like 3 [Pholidichthys leucotaenia]
MTGLNAPHSRDAVSNTVYVFLSPIFINIKMMSGCDSAAHQRSINGNRLCEECECSVDEGLRMKKREKNRVAAQKNRKKQTQRADQLHQACELLEQRNRKLRREVDSLSEEQHLLTEILRAHEPFCTIMLCSFTTSSSSSSSSSSL